MATAVLQPCKVRVDRIVVQRRASPISFTLKEILEKFVPLRPNETAWSHRRRVRTMASLRSGAFLGLVRDRKQGLVHFVLLNRDVRSPRFRWLAKKNRMFFRAIEEVYRVESVEWGGRWEQLESV